MCVIPSVCFIFVFTVTVFQFCVVFVCCRSRTFPSFYTPPFIIVMSIELIFSTVFSGVTSPANQKLGLRMTTLHEEQLPLARKHSLDFISDETGEDENTMKDTDVDKMDDSVRTLQIITVPFSQIPFFFL